MRIGKIMNEQTMLKIGPVKMTVINLQKVAGFYTGSLGMHVLHELAGQLTLGAGGAPLLILNENPQTAYNRRSPGLYHIAYLLPDRFNLARTFYQLVERQEPLQGAADHGVSEAIYLADPEGNGIELYRDRPREEWPYDENGQLAMGTAELNLEQLLFELKGRLEPWQGIAPGTTIGHIHLQVNDIPAGVDFYTRILGFELKQRYGNQAAFVSIQGYHHHIGMNTWNSLGAAHASEKTAGLQQFELTYTERFVVDAIKQRASQAGLEIEEMDGGLGLQDPSGNRISICG